MKEATGVLCIFAAALLVVFIIPLFFTPETTQRVSPPPTLQSAPQRSSSHELAPLDAEGGSMGQSPFPIYLNPDLRGYGANVVTSSNQAARMIFGDDLESGLVTWLWRTDGVGPQVHVPHVFRFRYGPPGEPKTVYGKFWYSRTRLGGLGPARDFYLNRVPARDLPCGTNSFDFHFTELGEDGMTFVASTVVSDVVLLMNDACPLSPDIASNVAQSSCFEQSSTSYLVL